MVMKDVWFIAPMFVKHFKAKNHAHLIEEKNLTWQKFLEEANKYKLDINRSQYRSYNQEKEIKQK